MTGVNRIGSDQWALGFLGGAALVVASCSGLPAEDPKLDQEIALHLGAAAELRTRFGDTDDRSGFDQVHEAARPLQGLHTACGVRRIDGARALLIDSRSAIVDGPTQGPWFDYAWRKAGC